MKEERFFWDSDPRRVQCPNPRCKKKHRVPIPKTEIIKCPCGTWFDPKEVYEISLCGRKLWISRIVQLPKGAKPIHFHDCICTWKGHSRGDDGPYPPVVKIPVYFNRSWVQCPKCESSFILIRKVKMEWVVKKKSRDTQVSKRERVVSWDYEVSEETHEKRGDYSGSYRLW